MTYRLGSWVERGELHNQNRNSVVGSFKLYGREEAIRIELVGNLPEPLNGKSIVFQSATPSFVDDEHAQSIVDNLQWHQFGPLGEFQFRPLRAFEAHVATDATSGDLGDAASANEPAAHELKLDWSGPDGRIVLEIPVSTYQIQDEIKSLDGNFSDLLDDAELDLLDGDPFEDLASEEEEEEELANWLNDQREISDHKSPNSDDVYSLFPNELDEQLSAANQTPFDALRNYDDGDDAASPVDDTTREKWALWDEITAGKNAVPVGELIDPPLRLRRPATLTEEEAEADLKSLLAELARHHIAVSVCSHLNWKAAYAMTLESIVPEILVHPQLRKSGWTQHYLTHEFCVDCESEFEARNGPRMNVEGLADSDNDFDPPGLDDVPF